MENRILDSRYKIIQSLGKGGFGKTYLAEDTKRPHNPHCVVKQLNPGIDDPKFLEMARRLFSKEAETLEKLGTYDRIPRLLANFEQEQEFYLVQEYIEGQTLSQELIPGEPWTEEKVVTFLQDCLEIIDFVHGNGVIHRDIKPDNLIRRLQDNKLVLVDFGTVKEVVLSQTQAIASTVAVGTRGYMPTEQARGKPRFTSDIYAMGIIAVQALTGVHPIQLQEDQNGEIIWQDLAKCSDRLKAIVSKMVRYHFKDRYQSAKDVLDALGLPQQAIPVTQPVGYTPTVKLESDNSPNIAAGTATNLPQSDSEAVPQPLDRLDSTTKPKANLSDLDQAAKTSLKPATPSPEASMGQSSKLMNWLKSSTAITLGVALAIGAIATGGMYFLSSNSQKKQEATISSTLEEIEAYYNAKNYTKCSAKIQDKTTKELGIARTEVARWLGRCELGLAQQEADTEEYARAIEIAIKVSENEFPNYPEVREKIDIWSEKVLEQAIKTYTQAGNLKEAKKIVVNVIPQSSAVKVKALDLKAQWEREYQTNQPIIETAQKALRQNRWEKAKIEVAKIADDASEYWRLQARDILEEANKETEDRPGGSTPIAAPPATRQPVTTQPPVTRQPPATRQPVTQPTAPKRIEPKPPVVIDVCRDAPELC